MPELAEWRYCPRCGAEVAAEDAAKIECSACGFVVYASSKPTASAAVLDDAGRVLLSRRGIEPKKGLWDLPGGFVEEDEHPLDCLRRELEEEASIEIEPADFLGVWVDRYGGDGSAAWTLNLYWTARVARGTPVASDDVEEFAWRRPSDVRRDELAFPHTVEVLAALAGRDEQA